MAGGVAMQRFPQEVRRNKGARGAIADSINNLRNQPTNPPGYTPGIIPPTPKPMLPSGNRLVPRMTINNSIGNLRGGPTIPPAVPPMTNTGTAPLETMTTNPLSGGPASSRSSNMGSFRPPILNPPLTEGSNLQPMPMETKPVNPNNPSVQTGFDPSVLQSLFSDPGFMQMIFGGLQNRGGNNFGNMMY